VIPVLEREPEPEAPPVSAEQTEKVEAAPPADEAHPKSTRKTIGLVVGGVGIAAVATGGVFAILTKSKDKEGDKLCNTGGTDTCGSGDEKKQYEEIVADAKRNRTIAIIGFSVGGAALAAGAILFFGGSNAKSETAVNVMPALGPGEAGAVAWGRF
jgi:flagellar basal body-associated protein FliL